jgi:hypothetical protein
MTDGDQQCYGYDHGFVRSTATTRSPERAFSSAYADTCAPQVDANGSRLRASLCPGSVSVADRRIARLYAYAWRHGTDACSAPPPYGSKLTYTGWSPLLIAPSPGVASVLSFPGKHE